MRETSEQIFKLILDTINSNKKLELNEKISTDSLISTLTLLKINWKQIVGSRFKESEIELVVKEMINAIDLDGDGQIGLSDFEFMLKYFNESRNGDFVSNSGTTSSTNK